MKAMLVQKNTIEALGRLCLYSRTREAVLIQKSIIGALGPRYSRVISEHAGGCAGAAEYYRSTGMGVFVQQSTTEALGNLCLYSRIQLEHSGGCGGTAEYNWITR